MLSINNSACIIIDVQGKLATLMYEKNELFKNLTRLIQGMQTLNIPILLTEQYPKGLGNTSPDLKALIPTVHPIEKNSFSCLGSQEFESRIREINRKQIIIAGIEAHICVYQTVSDFIKHGFEVHCISDAISARSQENRLIGLNRMESEGACMSSTEMCLFELLQKAGSPEFKTISALVK